MPLQITQISINVIIIAIVIAILCIKCNKYKAALNNLNVEFDDHTVSLNIIEMEE